MFKFEMHFSSRRVGAHEALPPREPRWRRGSSRNGNDPKWQWADLTPGG